MAVDVASAVQSVVQAGLVAVVQYATSASVASGMVISQTPASGGTVPAYTTVTIVVSTGPGGTVGSVTVPNVLGLTWTAATDALRNAQVSVDKYLWSVNAAAQGTVLTQSVASGTVVAPGTKVQLTLSAGAARVPPTVTVPLVH